VQRSGGGGGYPRRVLIAVAAALIPMIAGCEAGNNPPSLNWHQPTDGTFQAVGDITISNAFVLGAPIGAVLQPGQNAGLFLGIVNVGSAGDTLQSISAPGVAKSVQLPAPQIVLASRHAVMLTGPRPSLVLEHLLKPLAGGSVIKIRLRFAIAGSVTIKVPVMPMANFYTTLSPAPSPATPTTPTPTTPIPSPTASPSPSKTK
jgi:copper(I)-binding protein